MANVKHDAKSVADANRELAMLDLSGIEFPSDKLTVLKLRRIHPDLFDRGYENGKEAQPRYFLRAGRPDHAAEDIGGMLFCERLIVAGAYAAVKGIVIPGKWDLYATEDRLVKFYCRFGLSEGAHEAKEMIRNLTKQATWLANQRIR
jgi:hypothetical protein